MGQGKPTNIAERMPTEELFDIKEAIHMFLDHGERFIGWYMFKKFLKEQELPLNYSANMEKRYNFKIYDFNFRFIMPSSLEYSRGMIAYTEAERRFGVFRFPQKSDGTFSNPIIFDKKKNPLKTLDKNQIKELIGKRKVLTFEAFRIPRFGFEQLFIDEKDLDRIAELTDRQFARDIRKEYESTINKKISEVKEKIKAVPDYLLILRNVLNLQWKNLEEVAQATDNIIHG